MVKIEIELRKIIEDQLSLSKHFLRIIFYQIEMTGNSVNFSNGPLIQKLMEKGKWKENKPDETLSTMTCQFQHH